MWERIVRSNFIIKLKSWEYWPFGILQFPIFFYFGWLALRSRTITFFSASNPGITMGGMFGESKYDVLKKVPQAYVPKTVLIKAPATVISILDHLHQAGLKLPVVFKPDIGERGYMVKRIFNEVDIELYLQQMKFDFLAQELVDLPMEFGVFYIRHPHEEKGKVNSIVMKEMLTVTGNGQSTLQELILSKDRAKLQWEILRASFKDRLQDVIRKDEVIELVSIGNHCLGTTFLNGNHLINDSLNDSFDHISKQIDGFYFGRFDLRCENIEALQKGNVKILELNGCGAEPAHIYHPGFPISQAVSVLFQHWRNIYLIARANIKNGAQYTSFREAKVHYRKFKNSIQ